MFGMIDFEPNYPIKNKLNGINYCFSVWGEHIKDNDFSFYELWHYLKYNSESNISAQIKFAQSDWYDDNNINMYIAELSYNSIFLSDLIINRLGIAYSAIRKGSIYTSFSYDYKINDSISSTILAGPDYYLDDKVLDTVLSLTIRTNNNAFDPFVSVWFRNSYQDGNIIDNDIWIGVGANLFFDFNEF